MTASEEDTIRALCQGIAESVYYGDDGAFGVLADALYDAGADAVASLFREGLIPGRSDDGFRLQAPREDGKFGWLRCIVPLPMYERLTGKSEKYKTIDGAKGMECRIYRTLADLVFDLIKVSHV